MTIDEAVRSVLLADATVAGIVGVKVHPEPAPQGTVAPFIVLRVISDVPLNDLGGNTSGTFNATVQVDAYAKTRTAARQLGAAVHKVLGSRTDPTLLASRMGRRDQYDGEAELHCCSSDFSTWMKEE